jgi:putative membrane protein
MMYGYGNAMNGWGWVLMVAALLMVIGLVATGILVYVRIKAAARRSAGGPLRSQDAERILEQRFARVEVGQDEIRSRMDVPRSGVKP